MGSVFASLVAASAVSSGFVAVGGSLSEVMARVEHLCGTTAVRVWSVFCARSHPQWGSVALSLITTSPIHDESFSTGVGSLGVAP